MGLSWQLFCLTFSVFQNYISSVDNSPVTHERRKSKSRKSLSKTQHDVLEYILNHIVNEETPSYVVRVLLAALNKVVTKVHEICNLAFLFIHR